MLRWSSAGAYGVEERQGPCVRPLLAADGAAKGGRARRRGQGCGYGCGSTRGEACCCARGEPHGGSSSGGARVGWGQVVRGSSGGGALAAGAERGEGERQWATWAARPAHQRQEIFLYFLFECI